MQNTVPHEKDLERFFFIWWEQVQRIIPASTHPQSHSTRVSMYTQKSIHKPWYIRNATHPQAPQRYQPHSSSVVSHLTKHASRSPVTFVTKPALPFECASAAHTTKSQPPVRTWTFQGHSVSTFNHLLLAHCTHACGISTNLQLTLQAHHTHTAAKSGVADGNVMG